MDSELNSIRRDFGKFTNESELITITYIFKDKLLTTWL